MPNANSSRKPSRRAQQTTTKTTRKPKQTTSKSRRTKTTKPEAPKIDAARYEHWRLPTGFVLFLSDEHGRGHLRYIEDASDYPHSAMPAVALRLVKAWPVSEPDFDIVQDELSWLSVGSGC
jgi:hypothetical protein